MCTTKNKNPFLLKYDQPPKLCITMLVVTLYVCSCVVTDNFFFSSQNRKNINTVHIIIIMYTETVECIMCEY